MIVVPDYRGYRIEITAQLVDDAWDAGIEVRRTKYVTCRKATPEEAEHSADLWARRWMDSMAGLACFIGRRIRRQPKKSDVRVKTIRQRSAQPRPQAWHEVLADIPRRPEARFK